MQCPTTTSGSSSKRPPTERLLLRRGRRPPGSDPRPSLDDVCAAVATLLSRALTATRVRVVAEQPLVGSRARATIGGSSSPAARETRFPIRHGGHHLGHVAITPAGGRPLGPADRALVIRVASLVGIAFGERLRLVEIAHALRNELVAVKSFLALLPEALHEQEYLTTFRELALTEIRRLDDEIDQALGWAAPVRRKVSTDLDALARSTVEIFAPVARARGVTLRHRAGTTPASMLADAPLVRRALANLVLNAIEACGRGAEVEVAVRLDRERRRRWWIVSVEDTGVGTPAADRRFLSFVSTKSRPGGFGLPIASRVAAEHGGRLARTLRPGGRTVFSLHLPAGD